MTRSGACLSAAGHHPWGRLASAGAIGALVLALGTPVAAAAFPVFGGPGTITVGNGPAAVAVDSSSGVIYVANSTSGTVSVISGFISTVTGSITVGTGPEGIAVSLVNGTVYVTNSAGTTVSVISGSLL